MRTCVYDNVYVYMRMCTGVNGYACSRVYACVCVYAYTHGMLCLLCPLIPNRVVPRNVSHRSHEGERPGMVSHDSVLAESCDTTPCHIIALITYYL